MVDDIIQLNVDLEVDLLDLARDLSETCTKDQLINLVVYIDNIVSDDRFTGRLKDSLFVKSDS